MNEATPLVSIIIPVYNTAEAFLRRTIESAQDQTLKNIEIILVDDGATDNSGKICDEIAAGDSRVRVIHQENARMGAARNRGIDLAKGEYILFVDADDFISPSTAEKCYNADQVIQADMLMFEIAYTTSDGTVLWKTGVPSYPENVTEDVKTIALGIIAPEVWTSHYLGHAMGGSVYFGTPCRCFFRRDFLIENNVRFHLLYWEEEVFTFEAVTKAKRIGFVEEPFYFYRQTPGSFTHSVDPLLGERRITNFEEFYRLSAATNYLEECDKRIKVRMAFTASSIAYSIMCLEKAGVGEKCRKMKGFLSLPLIASALPEIQTGFRISDLKFFLIKHRLTFLLWLYYKIFAFLRK